MGTLHKTSQSRRDNAVPGPTRHRRFRLTPESLEYFQQFSHVRNSLETSCVLLSITISYSLFVHTTPYKGIQVYSVYTYIYIHVYQSVMSNKCMKHCKKWYKQAHTLSIGYQNSPLL